MTAVEKSAPVGQEETKLIGRSDRMNTEGLFELQQQDDVTIVRFIASRILDNETIRQMGDSLFQIVDEGGVRKLIINLGGVAFLSSAALNRLILLKKKVLQREGGMKLVGMTPEIRRVFEIARLDTFFDILDDQATALEQLGQVD
jgi:anti-sigma B factor antagonist